MMPKVFRSNRRTARVTPELGTSTLKKILIADKEADQRIYRREFPRRVTTIIADGVQYAKSNPGTCASLVIVAFVVGFTYGAIPSAKALVQNAQGQVTTACAKDDTLKSKACEYQNVLKLYGYRK